MLPCMSCSSWHPSGRHLPTCLALRLPQHQPRQWRQLCRSTFEKLGLVDWMKVIGILTSSLVKFTCKIKTHVNLSYITLLVLTHSSQTVGFNYKQSMINFY